MMVMQSYEKCQKELEEKVEELKSMQTKYEDFKAVVAKVRTVEVEMEAQMEDYVRAAKDNAAKKKHWAAKLEALKEKVTKEAADKKKDQEAAEQAALEAGAEEEELPEEAEGETSAAATADPLATLTPEELEGLDAEELGKEIEQLETMISKMTPDLLAIVEYKQRLREANARTREFDAVTAERDVQRQAYEGLRKQRLDEFMAGFRIIGMKLKEMYQVREEKRAEKRHSSSTAQQHQLKTHTHTTCAFPSPLVLTHTTSLPCPSPVHTCSAHR